MKIRVQGNSLAGTAFKRRLVLEGDSVVSEKEELSVAEEFYHTEIPIAIVEAFFEAVFVKDKPTHYLIRYWHGSWHPQIAVGLVLRGHMNENLGAETDVGSAIRFGVLVEEDVFHNPNLVAMLEASPYSGFVSIGMKGRQVVSVSKGVPGGGVFALLEAVTSRLSAFLSNPLEQRLKERWYGSLLVSRYPFPMAPAANRVMVEGLSSAVEGHFWSFTRHPILKHSFYTTDTEIGYASAWSNTVLGVGQRLIQTCRNLTVPQKQFRSDFADHVATTWPGVRDSL